ncbi:MAG: hypothetical protein Q7S79_00280 [bacterium]|nr:hypothetical protein [bacterium]
MGSRTLEPGGTPEPGYQNYKKTGKSDSTSREASLNTPEALTQEDHWSELQATVRRRLLMDIEAKKQSRMRPSRDRQLDKGDLEMLERRTQNDLELDRAVVRSTMFKAEQQTYLVVALTKALDEPILAGKAHVSNPIIDIIERILEQKLLPAYKRGETS